MAVDPTTFKAVMGQWPSGVTVITTVDAQGPGGMTASSFSSVSLNPPLVSVCVARHLAMHTRIDQAGVFAVNILSKNNVEDGRRFAGMLPGVINKFDGVDYATAVTGSPLLANTLGWVDCKLWARHDGGDHTIFVGEVLDAGIDKTAAPLLYHSRSWGQFADMLVSEVSLLAAGAEANAVIVENAFGHSHDAPDEVDTTVARVQEALAEWSTAALLVLDDTAAAADPLRVRLTIQAIAGLVGKTGVVLRLGAGPMALANVLVGLKSGICHLSVSRDAAGPYVTEPDVRTLLSRMAVSIRA